MIHVGYACWMLAVNQLLIQGVRLRTEHRILVKLPVNFIRSRLIENDIKSFYVGHFKLTKNNDLYPKSPFFVPCFSCFASASQQGSP
jgi:hypothetical protein